MEEAGEAGKQPGQLDHSPGAYKSTKNRPLSRTKPLPAFNASASMNGPVIITVTLHHFHQIFSISPYLHGPLPTPAQSQPS